jgi:hypothetical protein
MATEPEYLGAIEAAYDPDVRRQLATIEAEHAREREAVDAARIVAEAEAAGR